MEKIKQILKYLQGTLRYEVYYGPMKFLVRKHIQEQFEYRLTKIDNECYNKGECKMCGCDVPKLQFANEACEKPCYPDMMSRKMWNKMKQENAN